MIYFLLCGIWLIAGALILWLLPDIFVYGLGQFFASIMGGDPLPFPTAKTLAAAFSTSVAITLSIHIAINS